MRKNLIVAGAGLALAFAAPSVAADTVTCIDNSVSMNCVTNTATVGSDVEFYAQFVSFGGFFTFDFTETTLAITNIRSSGVIFGLGGINQFSFTSTTPFTAANIIGGDVTGFTAQNVTLSGNGALTVNLAGSTFLGNQSLLVSLVNTPAVPEPKTWAMMLLGFGAVGYSMRRSRKHSLVEQTA